MAIKMQHNFSMLANSSYENLNLYTAWKITIFNANLSYNVIIPIYLSPLIFYTSHKKNSISHSSSLTNFLNQPLLLWFITVQLQEILWLLGNNFANEHDLVGLQKHVFGFSLNNFMLKKRVERHPIQWFGIWTNLNHARDKNSFVKVVSE